MGELTPYLALADARAAMRWYADVLAAVVTFDPIEMPDGRIGHAEMAIEGARFMLPEATHGVIPDTGGVSRLYEICGHGVVTDMVLTGRVMEAQEALAHGVVSRIVPPDELDSTAREMAEKIAAAPAVTIKLARRVIKHLSEPAVRASMEDELVYQTFLNRSDDFAEFKAARADGREPNYRGS